MQIETLRVLYDPASYYRPWREAEASLSHEQRSGLNGHLIRSHRLPSYRPPHATQYMLVRRLVGAWAHLPAAAYLMACAKFRSTVVADRSYLAQPSSVHAFMQLRFREHGHQRASVTSSDALLGWGGGYLQALTPHLPAWLAARMCLHFSGLRSSLIGPRPRDDFDITCFWTALNYAANDTELSNRIRK
ncbi:hypothetical protein [Dyella sp. Tek66A03]|uniref:hypothetical protein n=1 Tax=Dyella sp. Tek66A03 TaxID=3458298 RepID=UPI00403E7ED9